MADKLKMHIWSTTPAISENIKLLQDKINELIDEIDTMKRAGAKTDSTIGKDLRVCEVSKPYFHEASQEDIDKLMKSDVTWKDIIDKYSQPEWCKYPDALSGQMGCWSLIDTEPEGIRTKISKEFCKTCPECALYGC